MKRLQGKVVLLTGAASGIGRAMAYSLASRGCHLALVDLDAEGLAETAQVARESAVEVSTHVLNITDREAVHALPGRVLAVHAGIDILVNNAGVAAGGTFALLSEDHFDRVMAVNFHALVRMTRTFLPHLQTRDEALIVNLSSLFGLIALPEQSAYCASKFAVRGFSNALRFELANTDVAVCVVHPGGVATNIIRNATAPAGVPREVIRKKRAATQKLLKMPPERAAEIIVRGMEKKKARILVGRDAKLAALLERIFPVGYWEILKLLTRVS